MIARKSPERCQSSVEVQNGETQTKQRVEKLRRMEAHAISMVNVYTLESLISAIQ